MEAIQSPPPRRRRRLVAIGALGLLGLLLVIQLVPYGRDHTNPKPTKQVTLATAAQRELFRTACQDCHSYQTDWLWYTNIAPVSWFSNGRSRGGSPSVRVSLSTAPISMPRRAARRPSGGRSSRRDGRSPRRSIAIRC